MLPSDFQFSQHSLQDYVDCARRFQLRYDERVAWPAAEAEPIEEHERHLQLGQDFHRLIHQHLIGVPEETLSQQVVDPDLQQWWRNYLGHLGGQLPEVCHPEVTLSTPVAGYRLLARYDLVAVGADGRMHIYDWKTSRKRGKRAWLADRLQTRVYPYVLARAGRELNGGSRVDAGQIEMVYWFANFPEAPVRFTYDEGRLAEDEAYLIGLVEQIEARRDGEWPKTDEEWRCQYCPYRSLCDRGVRAGLLGEAEELQEPPEEDFGPELDFEQIAEVDYT